MADDNITPAEPRATKGKPDEAGDPVAVDTIFGRPTKTAGPNSTFAERAAASKKASGKAVKSAEDKSVKAASSK